ncbi:MAG TPA: asparagine synthase (glutamine-hydrolyzing) [Pyrinomonadaceae bacterium]|jgi:asparagine synthase (glutamine-hydrolysing)|nr:asparagine synthase (glutamine-hydrolyzing) [Pyrinomonadaceae bacterium]
MCSISGILNVANRSSSELREVVRRMNEAQKHRGPDDHGVVKCDFQGGEVVLGNTRLAIIDTSAAGHQPMNDPATGNWITYNGETYNFKDLRDEIDQQTEPWSSNTDTEVVLRAYRRFGPDTFRKMRGMFALALWDNQRETLLLARDPLGIKPLYCYVSENQFVFASELRALLASELVPRRLSAAGVDSYLANGSVEAPLTIVDGVKQLLPGHSLLVRVSEARQIELTDIEFANPGRQPTESTRKDAVARLRHELEESVRLHLVSDVPLGVFLSGGMDSSALVALMRRISKEPPKTFSVVFDEVKFTEAPFSRAVSERFNTDHCEIPLSEDRLLEILPEAIAAIDQPTMDGINTFVVSRAVKSKGITVALSGLGGDELFAGYPSFRRALRFEAISQMSKRVLRAAAGVGRLAASGSVQRDKFWQLANSEGDPEDVYRISRQLFSRDSLKQITGRNGGYQRRNGNRTGGDVVNTISKLELTGYMTNTLLRDTDAMSMAHSLEVRVPFVDMKVVDYVLSLPGEWKTAASAGPKPLLADAVADLLPKEFLNRPKMGFTLPFENWLQGKLRGEVASVLERPTCGLNAQAVREVWSRFLEKPRAVGWSRPWSLYVLARWCEINGVS